MATETEDIKRKYETEIPGLKAKLEFNFERGGLPPEVDDKGRQFMRYVENFTDGNLALDFDSDAVFDKAIVVCDEPVPGQPLQFRFELPAGEVSPARRKIFELAQNKTPLIVRIKAEEPEKKGKKKAKAAETPAEPAPSEQTEITDIAKTPKAEPPSDDYCGTLLKRALCQFTNADAVWAARADLGMTEDDLKLAVKDAFNAAIELDAEYDHLYRVAFGSVLRFWWELTPGEGLSGIDFKRSGLKGNQLLGRIRDLFGIKRLSVKKATR